MKLPWTGQHCRAEGAPVACSECLRPLGLAAAQGARPALCHTSANMARGALAGYFWQITRPRQAFGIFQGVRPQCKMAPGRICNYTIMCTHVLTTCSHTSNPAVRPKAAFARTLITVNASLSPSCKWKVEAIRPHSVLRTPRTGMETPNHKISTLQHYCTIYQQP